MTFVIAKLTETRTGRVALLSDSKITDRNNNSFNRQTLRNAGQKIVIDDDAVVVGFAGDTPHPQSIRLPSFAVDRSMRSEARYVLSPAKCPKQQDFPRFSSSPRAILNGASR